MIHVIPGLTCCKESLTCCCILKLDLFISKVGEFIYNICIFANMANIPGLLVCPADEGSEEGFKIPSFSQIITVPDSQIYGNCKMLTEFKKLNKIAEGSFGVIYKCEVQKTKEIVALKKFKMPPNYTNGIPISVLREINILNTWKHDNIVNSYGTVAGKRLDVNYLIMDYGVFSLKELLDKKVDDLHHKPVVKCIMKQFLNGLDYIHSSLVIHRNINAENIIFTEKGVVKITGFHDSRFYDRGNMTPGVTELIYRAPELLFGAKMYGPAVDMWSTGCVLAYLLLKKPLFVGESDLEVLSSIFDVLGTPSENIWPGFIEIFAQFYNNTRAISESKPYSELKQYFADESPATRDIIKDLLVYFPNGRLEASQCIVGPYFDENPLACPLNELVAIIQKAGAVADCASGSEPMKID